MHYRGWTIYIYVNIYLRSSVLIVCSRTQQKNSSYSPDRVPWQRGYYIPGLVMFRDVCMECFTGRIQLHSEYRYHITQYQNSVTQAWEANKKENIRKPCQKLHLWTESFQLRTPESRKAKWSVEEFNLNAVNLNAFNDAWKYKKTNIINHN
jgi:hypothetical protein